MAIAVLTRDEADAAPYASALAALGLSVIAMPVTRMVAPQDPDALVRAVRGGAFHLALVASPRAAQELVRVAPMVGTLTVYAVGPATARVLGEAGFAVRHPPSVRDGVELARYVAAHEDVRGMRILVPRAEEGRREPLELLRAAGAEVVDVVAYRTVTSPDADVAAGLDALVTGAACVLCVFAPSQVAALAASMRARGIELASMTVAVCAIGETTAQALHDAGIERVAVAPAPTPEGMAQAASSVYPPKA